MLAAAWAPGQPGLWENHPYETRIEFRMPYMNFDEDIYIHSDVPNGLMRISYYSGANVFLANKSGFSYELIPIVDTLNCLKTSVGTIEKVVPDLRIFLEMGSWREVDLVDENGLYSIGFEFTLNTGAPIVHTNETWTYYDTFTSIKLAGTYKFIVNATAGGAPVNLTFVGHNGFLVPSHLDEYVIVYRAFYHRVQGIDKSMFRPPRGMPCRSFANIDGPFRTGSSHAQSRPLAALRSLALAVPSHSGVAHEQQAAQPLEQHMRQHPDDELYMRRQVAMKNLQWIQAANLRGLSYSLGVNHMVTWLPHERKKLCGRLKPQDFQARAVQPQEFLSMKHSDPVPDLCGTLSGVYEEMNTSDHKRVLKRTGFASVVGQSAAVGQALKDLDAAGPLPEGVDLREEGQVTPVKDQGTCGSCWTFGAMGTVEGQYAKVSGSLEVLSEQQLVDCSWSARNMGCDGGNDFKALSWLIQENKGKFESDRQYGPYLSQDGFCHINKAEQPWYETHGKTLNSARTVTIPTLSNGAHTAKPHSKVSGESSSVVACSHIGANVRHGASSEAAKIDMLSLVLLAHGPASISITASDADFYYYARGVYSDPGCSATDLDHSVVNVGYGRDKKLGLSYWIIKNSWSSHWGENGYIRIMQKGNVCGVLTDPVIAHLA